MVDVDASYDLVEFELRTDVNECGGGELKKAGDLGGHPVNRSTSVAHPRLGVINPRIN